MFEGLIKRSSFNYFQEHKLGYSRKTLAYGNLICNSRKTESYNLLETALQEKAYRQICPVNGFKAFANTINRRQCSHNHFQCHCTHMYLFVRVLISVCRLIIDARSGAHFFIDILLVDIGSPKGLTVCAGLSVNHKNAIQIFRVSTSSFRFNHIMCATLKQSDESDAFGKDVRSRETTSSKDLQI